MNEKRLLTAVCLLASAVVASVAILVHWRPAQGEQGPVATPLPARPEGIKEESTPASAPPLAEHGPAQSTKSGPSVRTSPHDQPPAPKLFRESPNPAHHGPFTPAAIEFYCTNIARYAHTYPLVLSNLNAGLSAGIVPPSNLLDFLRFTIDCSAIVTGEHNLCGLGIIIEQATNPAFRTVLAEGARRWFFPLDGLTREDHYPTNVQTARLCMGALLGPWPYAYSNVLLHNALYSELVSKTGSEPVPRYVALDPDSYPGHARDWALNCPIQSLRDQQQGVWKAATNALAPDVLEEILASWDARPPAHWNGSQSMKAHATRIMRKLIDEKRARLAPGAGSSRSQAASP